MTNCQGCGVEIPASSRRPRKWCSERCRKHALYSGICEACGTRTYNGTVPAPALCTACHGEATHAESRRRIIAALIRWTEQHDGVPPSATRWSYSAAIKLGHPEWAAEYRAGDWPSFTTVQDIFGSWNAGLEAAGLPTRGVGQYDRTREAA